jgi:hypothetical protein
MVADGSGGRWEGDEYRRIEAKNKALMKAEGGRAGGDRG